MSSRRIITMTTDFGLRDPYVAAMKGVLLELAPDAVLVDVSHDVHPQDIAEAAFLLLGIWRYFPAETIHMAVVDPGVGTHRKAIAVRAQRGMYIAPDNGLLAAVLAAQQAILPDGALSGAIAVELNDPAYHHHPVSNTFHGRDVFAPAAGHLARGLSIEALGSRLDRLAVLPESEPRHNGEAIVGAVVHIDRFGNAVTNIRAEALPQMPVISARGQTIEGVSANYQASDLAALVGSLGFLEIAVRNGSAAEVLGLEVGVEVVVRSYE